MTMSLSAIFSDLAAHLQSPEFLLIARHPEYPTAFTRTRKLPLRSLVALLLCGMRLSIQAELDQFFAHLRQQAQLLHHVCEQAFAQARAKLSLTAIPLLNDWVIQRAEHYGFVPLWQGLPLVAAEASTMRFGLRASHVKRAALAIARPQSGLQQLTRLTQIGSVQTLGKTAVNLDQQLACARWGRVFGPMPKQAGRGAQFP